MLFKQWEFFQAELKFLNCTGIWRRICSKVENELAHDAKQWRQKRETSSPRVYYSPNINTLIMTFKIRTLLVKLYYQNNDSTEIALRRFWTLN